jgi:hypothetical protein
VVRSVYKTQIFSYVRVRVKNKSETEYKMPISGAKPSDRPTVNRNKPTHDWTNVPNQPYTGPKPELPLTRQVMVKNGEVEIVPVEERTREWWRVVSSMPHCILWSDSDWVFALDTAMVHAASVYGSVTASSELRQRERTLGVTMDARRDLRIRYVDDESQEEDSSTVGVAGVTQIKSRRSRLANDA